MFDKDRKTEIYSAFLATIKKTGINRLKETSIFIRNAEDVGYPKDERSAWAADAKGKIDNG